MAERIDSLRRHYPYQVQRVCPKRHHDAATRDTLSLPAPLLSFRLYKSRSTSIRMNRGRKPGASDLLISSGQPGRAQNRREPKVTQASSL